MASVDRTGDRRPRVVVTAFVVFAAAPFVSAAVHAAFWQGHSRAPLATAIVAILLVSLVTRRRWAWVLLVLFYGFVVVSFAWEWASAATFVVDLIALGLLVFSPMRRYVGGAMHPPTA
jgi:hypothetical protein